MPSVQQKVTGAEMGVRRMLRRMVSHSRRRQNLPSRPDQVVFAPGGFCGGPNCRTARLPTSRVTYWSDEGEYKAREASHVRDLPDQGRNAGSVSQCRPADLGSLRQRLISSLDGGTS